MSLVSLYDAASLWMTPSGAEDGKLFSELPTDGSGDFTFSRGSNLAATRVDVNGLIEKGRENLLLRSNEFDNSYWIKSNATLTSGQSGYDGSTNAFKVDFIGGTASYVRRNETFSVKISTISFYLKAGTHNFIQILNSPSGQHFANFDISNGVTGNKGSGIIDSNITDVGNGWYRCSMTADFSAQVAYFVWPVNLITSSWANIATTSGNYYIQDAQMEIGLTATDYIESGATTGKAGLLEDEPRFDYSGGATCPSLLLEPSRTNLVEHSEYFGASSWVKQNCTITSNYAISPEGVNNASRIVSSGIFFLYQLFTFTNAVEYTLSFYVKSNGSGDDSFRLYAEGNSATKTATNEWVRHEYTFTGQGTSKDFGLRDVGGSSLDILIWGAQVEQASYPTSYIPNHSGGSVTRGADVCGNAGDVNTFNSAEGVLYFEVSGFDNDASDRYISISDGTLNNAIRVFYYQDGGTTFFRKNVNGAQTTIVSTSAINKSELTKIAVKYNSTNFDIFSNGVKISTNLDSNSFPISTLNQINFSNADGISQPFYGKTKQLIYFPTALADSECIKLTTL